MRDTRELLLKTDFPALRRAQVSTLQVNLGYQCNLSCSHCHVNAGPTRTEMMDAETVAELRAFAARLDPDILDLTGGAPELNPHFRELVQWAVASGVEVIDRCNLTILEEPGQEDLADFLAAHRVRVVASLPCYSEKNVREQRGRGVFETSIRALRKLNERGYGVDSQLPLELVYNPNGAFLPPSQESLERDYRERLAADFGVHFTRLLTITNMPIQRFGAQLLAQGRYEAYMALLRESFSAANLVGVMCRSMLSIDWRGYVFDCDFNQMLDLPAALPGRQIASDGEHLHFRDIDLHALEHSPIRVGDHCYGCTAGQGSSCGGALEN